MGKLSAGNLQLLDQSAAALTVLLIRNYQAGQPCIVSHGNYLPFLDQLWRLPTRLVNPGALRP
jgi:hypothetical protein